ncbi:O-glucosyltransferase rumi homolog, partial [Tigriopus californicus]|uniref:O-glucosyltransferase rumi homolog n=1 Tax=Tigriopus californicus TaxID=6832 RepID=UPI0027DA9F43
MIPSTSLTRICKLIVCALALLMKVCDTSNSEGTCSSETNAIDCQSGNQPDENRYAGCDCYSYLIQDDLDLFDRISLEDVNKAQSVAKQAVRYQIIQGKVYRSPNCLFPMRCLGIDHFLKGLAPKLDHDIELMINTHDWPFIHRRFEKDPLPLFSFSKTKEYYDISFPAWTFWAGGPAISLYPRGIGRWDLLRENLLKTAQTWPWEAKKEFAFFRGSRTSAERDNLILLSRTRPDLIDAQYTKNQAWKSRQDTLDAEPAEEVSFEDHCQYRYLFNFRGVAASFRFKHLFLCGSLVFHVGQEWIEFFYPAMIPWYHYIPVASDASQEDLTDLLQFARDNPDIAQRIARQGQEFVEQNLRMKDIECYWEQLLRLYALKLAFVPIKNEDL